MPSNTLDIELLGIIIIINILATTFEMRQSRVARRRDDETTRRREGGKASSSATFDIHATQPPKNQR